MKKILLHSYLYGNMDALKDYYDKNLKNYYKDDIKIVYFEHYKAFNNKALHYFYRIIESVQSYDIVISDFATRMYTKGKKGIFMDHGYGCKTMPGKEELQNESIIEACALIRNKVDYINVLSDRDKEYFYRSEELDKRSRLPEYVTLGLARADILFGKEYVRNSKLEIKKKHGVEGKKIMLYAPTCRGYDSSNEFPFNREDFVKLNEYMGKNNWIFFYRAHYLEEIIDYEMIKDLNNIKIVGMNVEPDTQKLLTACDLVITDYSSIFIDYLVIDKPVAFIPYDLERYEDFRGLVINYKNDIHTPGPKITKMGEVMDYLDKINNGEDEYKGLRDKAKSYYYSYFDGNACMRIWELILKMLDLEKRY